MKSWLLFPMLATLFAAGSALGAEISVLSGGAVEPGLVAAAETFRKETGTEVRITFATAPAIRQQVGAGEKADVVIAPPAVIEELMKSGKLEGQGRVTVGRVGVGVVVRDGAPKPDVSNTEAFKRAMLEAESLVYNTASSGIYVEKLDLWNISSREPERRSASAQLQRSNFIAARDCSLWGRCRRRFRTTRATTQHRSPRRLIATVPSPS